MKQPNLAPAELPAVAVIIPTLGGDTTQLERALADQTLPPTEVQVVRGVRPNGRARNQGVSATRSPYLFFIDDDALPGSPSLIEVLVRKLVEDETVGLSGAARVLPRDSSGFQRRIAAEIPRTVNAIPGAWLETNPPLNGYGHSLITTTCCAMRREVYQEAGAFSESLISGVDTDFFYRVRSLGYRFVMAPEVYVEHPAPASLPDLLRKFHWYGIGYGQEAQKRPEQRMGFLLPSGLHRALFLLAATLWLLPNIIIPYSYSSPRLELGFKPFKALSTYAAAWGYAKGWRDGF